VVRKRDPGPRQILNLAHRNASKTRRKARFSLRRAQLLAQFTQAPANFVPHSLRFIAIRLARQSAASTVASLQHKRSSNPLKEKHMKAPVEFVKDNVASAAVMMATVLAFAGAAFGPNDVAAQHTGDVVQMEAVVVTAQRMPVQEMDKVIVTASRVN
jgi:hypothetical protein